MRGVVILKWLPTFVATLTIALILTPSGWAAPPSAGWVDDALCVHSGWHYTHTRIKGKQPEYVLWGRGHWRTWDVPDGIYGGSGEGGWNTVNSYGGGMQFTLGTWNEAASYSGGSVPRLSSNSAIAAQPAVVQILAAWFIVQRRGHWGDWPNTARACGLR